MKGLHDVKIWKKIGDGDTSASLKSIGKRDEGKGGKEVTPAAQGKRISMLLPYYEQLVTVAHNF